MLGCSRSGCGKASGVNQGESGIGWTSTWSKCLLILRSHAITVIEALQSEQKANWKELSYNSRYYYWQE